MKMQKLKVYPLTGNRWMDLLKLFGENGAQGGCWCMWWRSHPKDYKENAGERNKLAFKALVDSHQPVGLLAFINKEVVGWCSVAPREQLIRLGTSTTWRPIDDLSVWSINCFFIKKEYRGRQIAKQMLHKAIEYARENRAIAIEAYPKDMTHTTKPEKYRSLYFDTMKMFEEVGFKEVKRRHPVFPIMRLSL